ncbi:helix-turn-helix domain-containing protein [Allostella humosa]|uniref:helix-turn-helix domain-containing protein n=1 Tax=Stella humosa TaxID=94 RepID=UPI000F4B210A|nr:helix-turn-helix domain-containing protein [Stella humosa]
MIQRTLDEIKATPPNVDWDKLRATTEEEIARQAADDGEPPGGYEPQPFADLKVLRARLGMSQDSFAAAIGVPAGTIRNWEQGRTYPDPAAITLLRIIEGAPEVAFGVLGVKLGAARRRPGRPRKAA